MSILVDRSIIAAIASGEIEIEPYDRNSVGTNSYDMHLAPTLMLYTESVLDCKKPNPFTTIKIPPEGYELQPNELYLAATLERTYTPNHAPMLTGKSSLGRLGLGVEVTAGFGDVGFNGFWTLELTVVKPLRVYAGMPIAQVKFELVSDFPLRGYGDKSGAKYNGQTECLPVQSKFYLNWNEETQKWR